VINPKNAQNNNYCDHIRANIAPADSERWYSEIFREQCGGGGGGGSNGTICR
jgi:hypothetical protein